MTDEVFFALQPYTLTSPLMKQMNIADIFWWG